MAQITANGIQIEYDTFGDSSGAPLLLVMGLGAQMIAWDPGFCQLLADRGHYVLRYDNRDVGLSQKFDEAGIPDVGAAMAASGKGEPVNAAYTLSDMAADGIGLLDALGIAAAHIVGASMGGMIVQQMAIDHPARVLSMTSITSSTGNPALPPAKPEAMGALLTPAPQDREGYIAHRVKMSQVIGSRPEFLDLDRLQALAAETYDRSFYPAGMARQLVGIVASPPRHELLMKVTVPTLVIHGEIDPLVPLEGGKDTAASMPGAELMIVEGMGHDLPQPFWGQIVDAISALTAKAPAGGGVTSIPDPEGRNLPGFGVEPTVAAQYARLVERMLQYCDRAVDGLTVEQLCDTQRGTTNSIGFDVWHVVRTTDNIVHFVFEREQPVWVTGGFFEAWNLPRVDQGTGMDSDDAYALRFPEPAEFARYTAAVAAAVVPRIAAMTDEYLAQFQRIRPWGDVSRMEAIGHGLIGHGNGHLGRASYARTLFGLEGLPY